MRIKNLRVTTEKYNVQLDLYTYRTISQIREYTFFLNIYGTVT